MKQCLTPAMIRTELKRMPATLDQTYDRILEGVPALHQPYVKSALHWLAFAARPLLLAELAEAAVLTLDSDFDPDMSRLVDDGTVVELCGALVTVTYQEHGIGGQDWLSEKVYRELDRHTVHKRSPKAVVSLSHQSVKEYLVSLRLKVSNHLGAYYISQTLANTYLAACCLNYLLSYSPGGLRDSPLFHDFPLLYYAAKYWPLHWKAERAVGEHDTENLALQLAMKRLLSPGDGRIVIANMMNAFNFETDYDAWDTRLFHQEPILDPTQHVSPLYIAAYLGDLGIVKWLVRQGCDVSENTGFFGCALAVAAYFHHKDIVDYLLEMGASPNLSYRVRYGTILQTACVGGDVKVVKALLDANADVNAEGGFYNTALLAAMKNEHFPVVKLLIESGADLNLESAQGSNLYAAAGKGDVETVAMLLSAGHNINYIGSADGTPLYGASEAGSVAVVQLLLRHGADPNRRREGYEAPLCIAAENKHVNVCRALLRAGANPNVHGEKSALECAIEGRDISTFRVILDSGCDPNFQGDMYVNAFHGAFWTGELQMARILLDRGAEFGELGFLESIERYDQDPWFFNTMMDRNAPIDAHTAADGSALMKAINSGHETVINCLLERGVYLDTLAERGTALTLAIERDMPTLAQRLVDLGADVEKYVTQAPLALAIREKHTDLIEVLICKTTDINTGGCFMAAVQAGNRELIRKLVNKGASIDLIDASEQCSALQYAAKTKDIPMIEFLLSLGAAINGEEGDDGDVLQYAMLSGDKETVMCIIGHNPVLRSAEDVGRSAVWKAVQLDMHSLIPALLEHGAPVDARERGQTALGLAWLEGQQETVALLLEHGAQFSKAGPSTLLDGIRQKPESIRELLEAGLDANEHDKYTSPLTVRSYLC